MKRRKSPSVNENWTRDEVKALIKRNADHVLADEKQKEEGHEVIYIPHPTIRNTFIRKIIT